MVFQDAMTMYSIFLYSTVGMELHTSPQIPSFKPLILFVDVIDMIYFAVLVATGGIEPPTLGL
jgi:hypothetical protein